MANDHNKEQSKSEQKRGNERPKEMANDHNKEQSESERKRRNDTATPQRSAPRHTTPRGLHMRSQDPTEASRLSDCAEWPPLGLLRARRPATSCSL